MGKGRRGYSALALVSLFAFQSACGEKPVDDAAPIAWSVTLNGSGSHKVQSIASDAEGNVIAAGIFSGELEVAGQVVQSDADDAFLGKWDAEGRLVWLKTFGGPDLNQAHGVAVDSTGNIYVTGWFTQRIDFGAGLIEATALQSVFLAKFAADGQASWSTSFGTEAYQSACCVEIGPQGDIFVAGDFVTTLNFGGEDLVSAGSSDIFVAVFDPDGAHLASRAFGDAAVQHATGLASDADSTISVLGGFQGRLDFGGGELIGGQGTYEALFVAKLDSRLNHIWSRNALPEMHHEEHAHGQTERAHSLVFDRESNVLMQASYSLGQAAGGQDFEAPAAPHGVVVQYARDGETTLTRALGSAGVQDEGAIAVDHRGHRWLAVSYLEQIDIDDAGTLASSGGRDVALIELDGQSRLLRSLRFGEPDRSEVAWDVIAREDRVIVGGWSRGIDRAGSERALLVQFHAPPRM